VRKCKLLIIDRTAKQSLLSLTIDLASRPLQHVAQCLVHNTMYNTLHLLLHARQGSAGNSALILRCYLMRRREEGGTVSCCFILSLPLLQPHHNNTHTHTLSLLSNRSIDRVATSGCFRRDPVSRVLYLCDMNRFSRRFTTSELRLSTDGSHSADTPIGAAIRVCTVPNPTTCWLVRHNSA
jgi:hypothetical protein